MPTLKLRLTINAYNRENKLCLIRCHTKRSLVVGIPKLEFGNEIDFKFFSDLKIENWFD
jgi:hypothetical protein